MKALIQNKRRWDSKGFTLVELLVVIGIIALLISILLPALNKVRQSASQLQCSSNMRQVAMSIIMYTNAHKGTLPYQGDWGTNYKGRDYPGLPIEQVIAIGLGQKPDASGNYPRVKAMLCPDAEPDGNRHYQTHPRLVPNFQALNGKAIANTVTGTMKIGSVARASEIALVYEATQQMFSERWNTRGK